MATTLGGITLREPDNVLTISGQFLGTDERSLDGTMLRDYNGGAGATKRRWSLTWTLLTSAERGFIHAKALDPDQQVFKPPHEITTYNVFSDYSAYTEEVKDMNGTVFYKCTVELIEA